MKLAIVKANNWQGLYVGKELVMQGIEVQPKDIVDAINDALWEEKVDEFDLYEFYCDETWFKEENSLPKFLSKVKKKEARRII